MQMCTSWFPLEMLHANWCCTESVQEGAAILDIYQARQGTVPADGGQAVCSRSDALQQSIQGSVGRASVWFLPAGAPAESCLT